LSGVVSYIGTGTCILTGQVTAGVDYLGAAGQPQSFSVDGFTIITTSLPAASTGSSYGPVVLQCAGTGTSAFGFATTVKWTKVELPKGLKLSAVGVLSGKPKTSGSDSITVQATETVSTLNGKKKVKTPTTVEATIPLTVT
jgi:hypothetical protein